MFVDLIGFDHYPPWFIHNLSPLSLVYYVPCFLGRNSWRAGAFLQFFRIVLNSHYYCKHGSDYFSVEYAGLNFDCMNSYLFNFMAFYCCTYKWMYFAGEDSGIERHTKSSVGQKWIPVGCGFGSLLYVTQAVFGDVSVVCRWVVKGYPETGPMPFPWG